MSFLAYKNSQQGFQQKNNVLRPVETSVWKWLIMSYHYLCCRLFIQNETLNLDLFVKRFSFSYENSINNVMPLHNLVRNASSKGGFYLRKALIYETKTYIGLV